MELFTNVGERSRWTCVSRRKINGTVRETQKILRNTDMYYIYHYEAPFDLKSSYAFPLDTRVSVNGTTGSRKIW